MAKKGTYRSDAFRSVHLAALGLYATGAIDDAAMRRFDKACLQEIRRRWDDFFDAPGIDIGGEDA